MALITFEDKVSLNPQPSVADKNKVKDSDMNMIKNAINNATTYSTTEQVVGEWIDGKPLYRKVIQFTTSSTTYSIQSYNLNISNLKMAFLDGSSFIYDSDNNVVMQLNQARIHNNQIYNQTYSWFRINVSGNSINYEVDTGTAGKNCYAIVLYTKTTD